MDTLYLQALYSRNQEPLRGRRLFEAFQRSSDACRLAYFVREREDAVEARFRGDLVTYAELETLAPDCIYVEGGLVERGGEWRIPENVLERELNRGAVVIVADVGWNEWNELRQELATFEKLCGVSVAYDGNEPVELFDPVHHLDSERTIVCQPDDIAYEPWLAPVYEGLAPFVVGNPIVLRAWNELVATCNRNTTQTSSYVDVLQVAKPSSGPFAAARRLGLGYLVLIGGHVSSDLITAGRPANIEWLTRLAGHLVERVRIDRRRNQAFERLFVSHRHENNVYAGELRDELRRRGFGTWLDARELAVGDDLTPEIRQAIDQCTHFVLLWSASCTRDDARWIRLELEHASQLAKPILVVRIDDTPLPPTVSDKLRVEAQVMPAAESARLLSLSIERTAKRRRQHDQDRSS